MRAVIQRVLEAEVIVNRESVGRIGSGLLIYLGVQQGDTNDDLIWTAEKILKMRIFPDSDERMNFPITDTASSILVVSQFTLCADVHKGNRPSFTKASPPEEANDFYEEFKRYVASRGIPVQSGVFGAMMHVNSVNDGPLTIILDSKEKVR